MKPKHRLVVYTFIGSTVGSYIPYLWGEINFISFSGLIMSSVGGVLGIILAYKKNKSGAVSETTNTHQDEEEVG